MHNKVVITGGPSSGKTTLLKELEQRGYSCFEEVSRELIKKAQEEGIKQPFLENPEAFNKNLLLARVTQFQEATKEDGLSFFDRGVHDVIGYMYYAKQSIPDSFIDICEYIKYDMVFILPPWSKIHVQDNERYETFEQAQQVYVNLKKTYLDYGYHVIDVPTGSIEKRVEFMLNYLKIHSI